DEVAQIGIEIVGSGLGVMAARGEDAGELAAVAVGDKALQREIVDLGRDPAPPAERGLALAGPAGIVAGEAVLQIVEHGHCGVLPIESRFGQGAVVTPAGARWTSFIALCRVENIGLSIL